MFSEFQLKSRLIIVATVLARMFLSGLYSPEAFSQDRPRVHTVTNSDFKFSPATLRVVAGDTIIWVNLDIVPHTATAADN